EHRHRGPARRRPRGRPQPEPARPAGRDDRARRVGPSRDGGRAPQAAGGRPHHRQRSGPHPDPQGLPAAHVQHSHREPEEAVRDRGRAGLQLRHPEPGALPRQRVPPARVRGPGHPPDPLQDPDVRGAAAASHHPEAGREATRAGAGDGPHGLGQEHHIGRHGRQDQQGAARPHPDDRRPHRVHPPPPGVHGEPARGGQRHAELRTGAEVRASAGPRRDPGGRASRPRDGAGGADHRRNGPPVPGHAAHQLRGRNHQPRDRRVPLAPAAADPRAAGVRAGGRGHPAAAAQGARPRPVDGVRDHGVHAGRAGLHPRRQDPPDLLGHAGRQEARHADAERRPVPAVRAARGVAGGVREAHVGPHRVPAHGGRAGAEL
ncbi:MAG: Twitching motility protein PilT, partial [uncultured Gemmatimonadetes bacterium]